MSEWIYGRNPVYEVLRAGRRQVLRLLIAEGVQEKGRLVNILDLCREEAVPVEQVSRTQLDRIQPGNQGLLLETSGYPYVSLLDILDLSRQGAESPLILILDTLQDPQNLGSLLRTAEVVGVHGILLPFRRTATITPALVPVSTCWSPKPIYPRRSPRSKSRMCG
jgi:23S rRNA (guanosine2251-2'-O)-methyltransferase